MNLKIKYLIFCVFLAGVAGQTDLEEERCIVQTFQKSVQPRVQKFFFNFASENQKHPDEQFFDYCTRVQDSVNGLQNEMIAILHECMTAETMEAYQKYVKILDEIFNFMCRLTQQDLDMVQNSGRIEAATGIRETVLKCARKSSIIFSMKHDFCLVDPTRVTACMNRSMNDPKTRELFIIYYKLLDTLISCETPPAAGKFAPVDVSSYIDQILLPSYAAAIQMY